MIIQGCLLDLLLTVKSTLVISTTIHSSNRLSRSENLVSVFSMEILKRVTNYCGKEEKFGSD